jgi:F-type H+-transporting ATPase subunit b
MHFDWWTLALQTVNVLVLIWLLGRFFFRPVMNIVAKRQEEASKLLSDAVAARQEAAAIRSDAETVRAEIAAERGRLIGEARQAAATEKAKLLGQSSQEISKFRSEAQAAIARDRATAGKAVVAHARELSVEIAQRLLARLPPSIAFAGFLDGLCREVQALSSEAKARLAAATADHSIEVVTAALLSAEEAGRVRDALNRVFGSETAFEFRVDPALIVGIEVHSRNMIVRNNWRADLDRIGEELGRDEHRSGS